MNWIKKIIRAIFLILITVITTSYTDSDVKYTGRWVDYDNGKFYDSDFEITLYVHDNIASSQSLFWEVETAAEKWNNVSGSFFNIDVQSGISGTSITGEYAYDEYGNSRPRVPSVNIIAFDVGEKEFKKGNTVDIGIAYRYVFAGSYNFYNWYDPWIYGADILISNQFGDKLKILNVNECIGENDDFSKCRKKYDFRSVIIHEMGHFAGIRHYTVNKSIEPTMFEDTQDCDCSWRTLHEWDIFAIQNLYGSRDQGQVSGLANTMFEPGDQKLTAGQCCVCKNECCGKKIFCKNNGSRVTGISPPGIENIITFREDELNTGGNADKLEEAVINDQEELIEMGISPTGQYQEIQDAAREVLRITSPLADATFRCDYKEYKSTASRNAAKDLRLTKEHIQPFEHLVTLVMAHTKDMAMKKELQKLKKFIPQMEGKTVVDAALAYDNFKE